MNLFKLGDLVETIDDDISGRIVEINGDQVAVEDDQGFTIKLPLSTLMLKTPEDLINQVSYEDAEAAKRQKDQSEKRAKSKSHLRNKDRAFTVDLHIHKLVDSTRGMTNYDMLNLQLETAKRQLEFAMRKNMLSMVFIHGVGEGVLKMELQTLLRRYENVQFYEADYRTYGFGATEVRIFQNS
jgi:dsDNA-specific endonuclease/ATPase MutS2